MRAGVFGADWAKKEAAAEEEEVEFCGHFSRR